MTRRRRPRRRKIVNSLPDRHVVEDQLDELFEVRYHASVVNEKYIPTNRLRSLRVRSRLTVAELAKLMDRKMGTVQDHEASRRVLDAVDIRDYCRVFKCDSWELFVEPPESMIDRGWNGRNKIRGDK